MTNLRAIVPNVAVSIDDKTVFIELICSDELGARVLYEDVIEKMQTGEGLKLRMKGKRETESGAAR